MRQTFLAAIAALALTPLNSQAQEPTADTAGLQKAAQNPVAGMISVPIQSNVNFGIGPFDRNQNVLNIQPVIPVNVSQRLEHDHSLDFAIRVAARTWHGESGSIRNRGKYPGLSGGARCAGPRRRIWPGRHDSDVLLFTSQTTQIDLGRGADLYFAYRYRAGAGARKAQCGTVYCGAGAAWSVDRRCAGEQHLVGCGIRGPRRREPDVVAVFHQLQPEKGLGNIDIADDHGQLAGFERKCMDSTGRWRSDASFPIGISASEWIGVVFRECCASGGRIAVGDAAATIVLVSEAAWCSEKELRRHDARVVCRCCLAVACSRESEISYKR